MGVINTNGGIATGSSDTDLWKTFCRDSPIPVLLLDSNQVISVASRQAANLLGQKCESLEGRNANVALCLDEARYHWDPTQDKLLDTWIDNARVVFEVSCLRNEEIVLGCYLTIVLFTKNNVVLYEAARPAEGGIEVDDDQWKSIESGILDQIPAAIVAVSVDGRHVYQNALAHKTLGPIALPDDGDARSWIQRQYEGALSQDGEVLHHTQLPIWQAAVEGRRLETMEVQFGKFSYFLSGQPLYDKDGKHCGGFVFSTDVTEIRHEALKKEQLALQQSDVKFREITNTMEQIVWVSKGENVDYWNNRWYEFTGASEEQSMGTAWYSYMHPDDSENTKNNWLLVGPDEDRFITQHRLRSADGSYRWFLARALAVRDTAGQVTHWLGTSTDITQITEALQEAKLAKEQLFNIMQIAHVHYFVVECDFKMSSVFLAGGPESSGLYGQFSVEKLLNQDVRRMLSSGVVEKLNAVLSGRVASATDECEIDGIWWKTQLKAMRNESTGAIVGVVGTAMDINEEKRKDEQLARASTERLVALQNSQFKGEFLARMSHEIRTPIGGILGMVQLMKDAFHPDDAQQIFHSREKEVESAEYLESIKRCGDALLVIINDILDFSKIEVGKMDIESTPFDMELMAKDVYAAARHGPHTRNTVEFVLDYQVPKNLIFKGDSNRIRQILMNLMSNSLKFTEEGSVTCRITLLKDEPNAEIHRVKFEVIDTGIGISKPALEKLFNPFVQADSSTARRFGGTGLGLSIARQLVKLMSGALNLDSVPSPEPGHGSVATCIIPLELSNRQELKSLVPAPLIKFEGSPHVLLVEDNKINQVIAQKTLQKLGLVTSTAENGQEAIDFLLKALPNEIPRIILMDCQMPLLDGYEATSQIRKFVNGRLRTIPIVAMTASAISGDRERCIASGMNDYISKPINPLLLSQTIKKYLDPQPGVQSTANLVSPIGTNIRPSFEAVTGADTPMQVAGVDPHASRATSRSSQHSDESAKRPSDAKTSVDAMDESK